MLEGRGRARLLVRGVGLALARFDVGDVLANPTLVIVDRDGRELASNDDWHAQQNAADVAAAPMRAGAFPLAEGSRDAALVIQLPAGSYTALVRGVATATGVALVEVYEVP